MNQVEPEIYHVPKLSAFDFGFIRTPGPGLGNLLFPVSRALIGQKELSGTLVYPTFRQLKVGTFLRNERDKRTYGNVFRPRNMGDWKDWSRSKNLLRVREGEFVGGQSPIALVYEGLRGYFHDLRDHRELIHSWLEDNMIGAGQIRDAYDIGIHVRVGDFSPSTEDHSGFSVQQPADWYHLALKEACSIVGRGHPKVILFTDGSPQEIKDLLGLDNFEVDPGKNAITSIVNLSKARVVITSRSSFSMWAAFLGQGKAIWNKNFDLTKAYPVRRASDIFV